MTEAVDAALIRTNAVCKTYRSEVETVWAARDVDFVARSGEFVCIYGASGSGKSTLLNLLAGLDLADSGEIRVGGVEVGTADEERRAELRLRTVGVVFQDHNLIQEFTAVENVALPLEALGLPAERARSEALEQLSRVGLAGLEDRMPWQMSGGQRQRVGVARALTGQRKVLLADEPTGALDSAATRELFSLIRELCDEGVLAVVCSHDPRCRDYADTVYEVIDGRLEARS
ncbi:ABC transporter ATP-binding protein [Streptomyces sp. L-9-10]|uniref:ABC transporter ATP-binding protein n=1 Tax=Streptomyces sp. L-9-10 TaxID=1478131 RepID=UPI001F020ECF|nr:ABC transporter ATP-binding protein [Streptomyces sp. L-9-10]